jgi:hypothetical protein
MFSVSTPPESPIANIRRPPSYSDSFFILHGGRVQSSINRDDRSVDSDEGGELLHRLLQQHTKVPVTPRIHLFFIKAAIHIFLVSVFETIFFFQYVSQKEDNGVLATINTYYQPIIQNCPNWNNQTRAVVFDLLEVLKYQNIELQGDVGKANRQSGNQVLLGNSLIGSAVCFAVMLAGTGYLTYKKTPVRWWVIVVENISMVLMLSIYEYIFFHFIVYNYSTISTPELNAYIVKGLLGCVDE